MRALSRAAVVGAIAVPLAFAGAGVAFAGGPPGGSDSAVIVENTNTNTNENTNTNTATATGTAEGGLLDGVV